MAAVATIPPFETFYAEHGGEVLALLRRRLGRDRADDAFQETFLRALRAYDRLKHGEHLRAWILTIATRVAIDTHRRAGEPTDELPELAHLDGRPAHEELSFLTGTLPPRNRQRSSSATATTSTTRRSRLFSTRRPTPRDRRRPQEYDGCEGGSHDRSHRSRPHLP